MFVETSRSFALSSRWRSIGPLILAAAAWGIGTVISKRAVAEIPPWTLLTVQLAVSVGALLLLSGPRRALAETGTWRLGSLGVLNPGIAYALSLFGLVSISASLSVLLWALEPLLILGLARWLLDERVGRLQVVLSLVAIGGMTLVLYEPGSGGQTVGIALTFAGVACCAVYTAATRKLLGDEPTLSVVLAQHAAALAFAVTATVLVGLSGGARALAGISTEAWLSALASGLVYYALAYWFYLTGLRRSTASFAAMAFYLIPIFGVTAGIALLGERLDPMQWLGVAIVLAALLGVLLRPARGRAPGSSAEVV